MTVQKMVSFRIMETTEFLNDLSLSVRGKFLEDWMYDLAESSIESSLRLSTKIAFEDKEFFQEMPFQL